MWPSVQLTYFNSVFGGFNLQCLQISEPKENVVSELSYCIVFKIPGIKDMFNNESLVLWFVNDPEWIVKNKNKNEYKTTTTKINYNNRIKDAAKCTTNIF